MLKAIWNFLFPVKGETALKYTERTATVPEAPYKIEPPVLTTKVDGIGHESVKVKESAEKKTKTRKSKSNSASQPKTSKENTSEKIAKATTPRKTTKKAK